MVLQDSDSQIIDELSGHRRADAEVVGSDTAVCEPAHSGVLDGEAGRPGEARLQEAHAGTGGKDETVAKGECRDRTKVGCCAIERGGLRLSPWALVAIFVYVNLLNYVDRGLVNGMLPEYCVDCIARTDEDSCVAAGSCEWHINGTRVGAASCIFNSSVVPRLGIAGSLNIKETAQGVIAGSFMGGYCIFSPIFAYLSTVYKPFTLMGLGLSAWCFACGLAALAHSFEALIVARVVSGLGEASFQCIAPCFIDDSAPASVKGKVLAAFFMAVPIGQAIGYGYGGFMCSSLDPVQLGFAGWRAAFALEGIAMLPLALTCFLVTNRLKADEESRGGPADGERGVAVRAHDVASEEDCVKSGGEVQRSSDAWGLVRSIVCNGVWLCTTLGYAGYTFSIGAMAVWAPSYLQRRFGVPLEEADLMFGAVAVITGLVGTIGGGLLLDTAVRVVKTETQEAALLLTVVLMCGAWPCTFLAFSVTNYTSFLLLMFVGQLLAFATTSPVNGVLLWSVPAPARTLSMALSVLGTLRLAVFVALVSPVLALLLSAVTKVFAMHLLGDVPSPVVVGAMLEAMADRPDLVMRLLSATIGVAVLFWAWGYALARKRNRASLSLSLSLSFSDTQVPLLDPA